MKAQRRTAKKQGILYPLLLAGTGVVILTTVVLLIIFLQTRTISDDLYYFDTGVRFEKTGTSVLKNEKGDGVYLENRFDIAQGGELLELGSAPLYYGDRDRIVLPQITTLTMPEKKLVARIDQFAEIESRQGAVYALIGSKEYRIEEGFLYDGKQTYIFLDKVTLSWDGNVVEMEPLSYAIVIYNQRIELYPYNGTSVVEQTGTCDVVASAQKGYTLDLSKCILKNAEGFESLLISQPSLMEPFEGA